MRSSSPLLERQECAGAGVHDAISAIIAEKEGFDFLWLSSFALSAAIGLPDVGLINVEDVLSLVRPLERVTRLPLVVDLDAGHGVPLQTNLVVEKLVRAGVAAVCIEDNPAEKRCSLYDEYDRTLAPVEVHEVRIRAARTAVDARGSNCAVIARTEALVAGLGVDECLRRAAAYADAGADAVFVQSVSSSPDELMEFLKLWNSRTPVFLAPTRYPDLSRSAFFAAGATHVIYANHALRAAHAAIARTLRGLAADELVTDIDTELSSVAAVSTDVGEPAVRRLDALFNATSGRV